LLNNFKRGGKFFSEDEISEDETMINFFFGVSETYKEEN